MPDDRKNVGNCPRCGAPLYETTEDDVPEIHYTCECRKTKTQQSGKPGMFKTGSYKSRWPKHA